MNKKLRKFDSILMVILLCFSVSITVQAKPSSKSPAKIIVIDPGCQAVKNNEKDSVGPGAWTRISEDLVGAKGVSTGNNEYDINLRVALLTKSLLDSKGYQVELTRTTNDVDITNPDRAMVANTLRADLFISIHSSNKNKDAQGISVICGSKDNPYCFNNYKDNRLLADTMLGSLIEKTSVEKYKVCENDELPGINWCTVPNVVVELGNLNNPTDDEKLADEDYQKKLAEGIVAGVESYFSQK